MEAFRKGLGVVFTVVGAYYCALSAFTLVRLPTVTTRWIQRSGDPDFQYDYAIFMIVTALGAALVGVLGLRTAIQGVGAARGRRGSSLGLAMPPSPSTRFGSFVESWAPDCSTTRRRRSYDGPPQPSLPACAWPISSCG